MEVKEISHIEKLAARLMLLKIDLSKNDRIAAATKHKVSRETISRYLNNRTEIMDADTAVKLIQFFQGRITEREKCLITK